MYTNNVQLTVASENRTILDSFSSLEVANHTANKCDGCENPSIIILSVTGIDGHIEGRGIPPRI